MALDLMAGIWAGREFHNWAVDGRNDLAWLTRFVLGTSTASSWDLADRRNLGSWHECLASAGVTTQGLSCICPAVAQLLYTMLFILGPMTRLALFWMQSSWAKEVGVAPIQALLTYSILIASWPCRWWLSGQVECGETLMRSPSRWPAGLDILVTTWFQDKLLFKVRPRRSTLLVSSRITSKKWSDGCMPSASLRLKMVVALHLATPNRTFHVLAHVSILTKSWLRDVATGSLSSLDLTKDIGLMVALSAYKMDWFFRSCEMSSMKMISRRGLVWSLEVP